MPEVKNCLTCKLEPEWNKEQHGCCTGNCKFIPPPLPVTYGCVSYIVRTVHGVSQQFDDCPAWQPKESPNANL